MSDRDFGAEARAFVRGRQSATGELRAEILDLCDAIDQQLIGYFAIAEKLRAIVGGEDE